MQNENLCRTVNDTLVRMYTEDLACENANQGIYNAVMYQFLLLNLLATRMDVDAVYKDAINDIVQKADAEERSADNILKQICIIRRTSVDMLEAIALLADEGKQHIVEIQELHNRFSTCYYEKATNINQQMFFASEAAFRELYLVIQILDDGNRYGELLQSILDDYEQSFEKSNGIYQQIYSADKAFYDCIQLLVHYFADESCLASMETVQSRLNRNYERSKGIFHDTMFVLQASVEMLALCAVAYEEGDLSEYGCPNWAQIAWENRPKTENVETPKPTPTPSTSTPSSTSSTSSGKSSGGCYVATCVYGSYDCPEVWTLRRYRDDTLGASWYGRLFVRLYYAVSPTLVKWFGKTRWFKRLWRGKLDRMVKRLQESGVESTPYKDKTW